MIAYLEGEVIRVTDKELIIDVNHMGFLVGISARDAAAMPAPGEMVRVYTYMSVREDDISLFGFLSEDDLQIYRQMLAVSGIGPKAALQILSVLSADDIRLAVLADDPKTIAKAPGIGPKTARKMILELKDRIEIDASVLEKHEQQQSQADEQLNAMKQEVADILMALGYSRSEAVRALRMVQVEEGMDTDALLQAALAVR